MDDNKIIDLYWARSENAITETAGKYGRYCHYIAYNILQNYEDSEECVSDTYLKAWDSMPPRRPERLSAFLGKITRNLSLNRLEKHNTKKRGGGQATLVLEELAECVPARDSVERAVDDIVLADIFNRFLEGLPAETRKIFMRRYWYLSPVKEIARDYNIGESKVKVTLFRLRNELKQVLEKEGIALWKTDEF